MKVARKLGNCVLLKFFAAVLLGLLGLGQIALCAATETARVVKYGQDDIVAVHAKLRYSTLIVLPENEEILDFTTGDKEFWIINGVHNLCYLHAAQAGIRSNLNLITASGHLYSFLLEEISNEPNFALVIRKGLYRFPTTCYGCWHHRRSARRLGPRCATRRIFVSKSPARRLKSPLLCI